MWKNELKKAFINYRMLFILIFSLGIVIYVAIYSQNYIDMIYQPGNALYDNSMPDPSFLQMWIGQEPFSGLNYIFYGLLFPIFATLPYAGSHYRENKIGYSKNVIIRIGKKRYWITKFVVAFFSGGISVSIVPVLSLLVALTFYPVCPMWLEGQTGVIPGTFLSALFYRRPLCYAMMYILFDFLVGGLFAIFSISLTYYTRGRFEMEFLPALFNLFLAEVLNFITLDIFVFAIKCIPFVYNNPLGTVSQPLNVVLSVMLMFVVSGLAYFTCIRKDLLE